MYIYTLQHELCPGCGPYWQPILVMAIREKDKSSLFIISYLWFGALNNLVFSRVLSIAPKSPGWRLGQWLWLWWLMQDVRHSNCYTSGVSDIFLRMVISKFQGLFHEIHHVILRITRVNVQVKFTLANHLESSLINKVDH